MSGIHFFNFASCEPLMYKPQQKEAIGGHNVLWFTDIVDFDQSIKTEHFSGL